MTRFSALVATSLLLGHAAPFQCESTRDPNLRREDTAGDALWGLAENFRQTGDEKARKETLRYLVERYPSNRYAPHVREELGASIGADAGDAYP